MDKKEFKQLQEGDVIWFSGKSSVYTYGEHYTVCLNRTMSGLCICNDEGFFNDLKHLTPGLWDKINPVEDVKPARPRPKWDKVSPEDSARILVDSLKPESNSCEIGAGGKPLRNFRSLKEGSVIKLIDPGGYKYFTTGNVYTVRGLTDGLYIIGDNGISKIYLSRLDAAHFEDVTKTKTEKLSEQIEADTCLPPIDAKRGDELMYVGDPCTDFTNGIPHPARTEKVRKPYTMDEYDDVLAITNNHGNFILVSALKPGEWVNRTNEFFKAAQPGVMLTFMGVNDTFCNFTLGQSYRVASTERVKDGLFIVDNSGTAKLVSMLKAPDWYIFNQEIKDIPFTPLEGDVLAYLGANGNGFFTNGEAYLIYKETNGLFCVKADDGSAVFISELNFDWFRHYTPEPKPEPIHEIHPGDYLMYTGETYKRLSKGVSYIAYHLQGVGLCIDDDRGIYLKVSSCMESGHFTHVPATNPVDMVNAPPHYKTGKIEVIDIIEDQKLNYHKGNACKYLLRAGKKDADKEIEDMEKCVWYALREIERLKAEKIKTN